jgi:hypothetical protein
MLPKAHLAGAELPNRGHIRLPGLLTAAAVALGCAAVWIYHNAGLTLSHYDAKAHLVVARRVVDSITPGWQQLGAVWLPLPHLLNLPFVQVDALYRSGASAVAFSVLSFALAVFACARLILQTTGCRPAAFAGTLVLLLNPNVLYLQATPMTEALLVGLTLLSITLLVDWVGGPTPRRSRAVGWTLVAACLTRYEAWPVAAAALVAATWALWRGGRPLREALNRSSRLALYPASTVVAFLLLSRVTVGAWFVTGGFYRPDNLLDMGKPLRALSSVWWGVHVLSNYPLLIIGTLGAGIMAVEGLRSRQRALLLVPLALTVSAVLPWYAFFEGHPFRIRYMVPLIPAMAVLAGISAGLLGRARSVAAAMLAMLVVAGIRPFDPRAPMVAEAQLDRSNHAGRQAVTACLKSGYRGEAIMASMGSLAHYMYELSDDGFALRDFLHEGNGDIWLAAIEYPWPHAGWILIEEEARGGDMLAALARENPHFLDGYERTCEGGGVALYRRLGIPGLDPGPAAMVRVEIPASREQERSNGER